MRCVAHVDCMGDVRGADRVLMGRPEVQNPLEDIGINGRIILKGSSRSTIGKYGQGHVASTCECGNEPSGSIKCSELFD